MKMRMTNKKLAFMVGMALSAGITFGIAPGDAYAYTSVGYFEDEVGAPGSTRVNKVYIVTMHDGTKQQTTDVDKAVAWMKASLSAESEASAIDFSLWKDKSGAVATGAINAFQNALAGQSVGIAKGQTLGITSADGNAYALTANGDAAGSVEFASGGTIKIVSDMASVGVVGAGASTTKIDVASGATLGAIATVGTNTNSIQISGDGKVEAVGVGNTCTVSTSGGATIDNLAVVSGGSLSTDSSLSVGSLMVAEGASLDASSGSVIATNLNVAGSLAANSNIAADTVNVASTAVIADGTTLTADSVQIASGAGIASGTAVNADNLVVDANTSATVLGGIAFQDKAGSAKPKNVSFANGLPSKAQVEALVTAGAIEDTEEAKNKIMEASVNSASEAVAKANPFVEKLPTADYIANNSDLTDAQKAKLTEAVQQAGKTVAAPGVTSARAATAITNVLTNNVVNRTAEIRGFASAVDEGRPAPDKMWFQYKHTNMDVDGGDVYSKSTINTNNFQLGYDTQVGANDYLGAYIGTTTGNADFNGPAQNGRIDIENSFDFGVYGTHMLPNDQYIDYMIHTGKFDSKLNSDVKYGTNDTGAMVGYGAKIAQNDRLTLNPYIQLAYDKISVDSYYAGPNYIKSDDSNNWTAKLGLNLIDASGLYGGVAYSRGLSGSYNAYINGVSMPTNDYNANVLYLSLGYRASMAKNAVLDLSMEKTFMDYKGWTAAGKVNFYF